MTACGWAGLAPLRRIMARSLRRRAGSLQLRRLSVPPPYSMRASKRASVGFSLSKRRRGDLKKTPRGLSRALRLTLATIAQGRWNHRPAEGRAPPRAERDTRYRSNGLVVTVRTGETGETGQLDAVRRPSQATVRSITDKAHSLGGLNGPVLISITRRSTGPNHEQPFFMKSP